MPEWLINALAAMGPIAILAAGGLWVRVSRLEKDTEEFVRKDIYEAHTKAIEEKLTDIKEMIKTMSDRIFENTSPGVRRP